MKLLLDENVDARLLPFLVSQSHDVKSVLRDYPSSLDDETILALAVREGRAVITGDKDFGDIIHRRGLSHSGVILLRLRARALWHLQARVEQAITRMNDEPKFLVVTDRQTRMR
jgi:predicted nuclease of predicted toxin-antitoxin system